MANSYLYTNIKASMHKDEAPKYTKAEAQIVTDKWNKAVELLKASGVDLNRVPIVPGG